MRHNTALWVLQWFLGLYFIGIGVMHFVVPEGLPDMLSWMYDLDDAPHATAGVAEILGGLGLILPGVTRVLPGLTPLAAAGLILVMIGAAIFHIGREEYLQLGTNVVMIALLSYVAYGRARLAPLGARGATAV